MLTGRCPNCGFLCGGWVLSSLGYQMCPHCGYVLEVADDNHTITKDYSPFAAIKFTISQDRSLHVIECNYDDILWAL